MCLGCHAAPQKAVFLQSTNQATTGASCSLFGAASYASNAIYGVQRGEQKVFLHVRFLFLFPVPSHDFDLEMSDSFYLMWKKNTEINYLIFLML